MRDGELKFPRRGSNWPRLPVPADAAAWKRDVALLREEHRGPANDRVKAQWRVVIQFARRYLGTNVFDELKMQILKSAMLYFALVFGAGFVLGTIRVLLVVPRIGTRTAELIETPLMIVVSFFAARWVVRRLAIRTTAGERIAMGLLALGFLLGAELTLVLWLRGLTITEYLVGRDPVSGTAYVIALGVFAV